MADEQRIGADQVARKQFATAFRGFDQHEVRAFLAQVAAELGSLHERESSLRERLAHASDTSDQAAAAPRAFAEDELEAALGVETTRVLHAAREAAAEIRARAEESVARMLREANDEATRMRTEAEHLLARRTEEADASAAGIIESAEQAAVAVRSRAEAEATAAVDEAQSRGREMLGEAQAVRERVLKDLARRRKVATAQLEQLLAGRERLIAAYDVVRSTLDAATSELSVAETEARIAAEAVAARAPVDDEVVPVEPERLAAAPEPPVDEPAGGEPAPEPAAVTAPAPEPPAEIERSPDTGMARPDKDDDRRSSSLRLLRRRTEVADIPLLDEVESVRIIRPDPVPEPVTADAPAPALVPEPAAEAGVILRPVAEPAASPEAPAEETPVDDLFARLRADRAAAVAQAEVVLAAAPAPEPEPEAEADAEAEPEVEAEATGESRFERRDAVLEPTERALTKALKRALADEQNEVLDGLRRLRGAPALDTLLPSAAEHVARYEGVAVEHLRAGATAGAASLDAEPPDVSELGSLLGQEISDDLRVRIERALESTGSDQEALVEAISATYREWKTSRSEPFSRHHAAAAYAFGAFSGAPVDELVWIVDRAEGGCPDCDDNALAGVTPRGSEFPTGQPYPPAHAGCRCLVLPAT